LGVLAALLVDLITIAQFGLWRMLGWLLAAVVLPLFIAAGLISAWEGFALFRSVGLAAFLRLMTVRVVKHSRFCSNRRQEAKERCCTLRWLGRSR